MPCEMEITCPGAAGGSTRNVPTGPGLAEGLEEGDGAGVGTGVAGVATVGPAGVGAEALLPQLSAKSAKTVGHAERIIINLTDLITRRVSAIGCRNGKRREVQDSRIASASIVMFTSCPTTMPPRASGLFQLTPKS